MGWILPSTVPKKVIAYFCFAAIRMYSCFAVCTSEYYQSINPLKMLFFKLKIAIISNNDFTSSFAKCFIEITTSCFLVWRLLWLTNILSFDNQIHTNIISKNKAINVFLKLGIDGLDTPPKKLPINSEFKIKQSGGWTILLCGWNMIIYQYNTIDWKFSNRI